MLQKKRKFSADEVKKHYDDRWNKPILKTDTLSSGVYRSFSEFINNRPSIRGYSIQKTKLADVLYSSGDGGEAIPLRDVWGYCDGQRIFIKSGENFFMLVKKQNSFYFLGSRELTKAAPLNENQSTIQRPFPYVDRYAGPEMQAFGNDHYLTNRLEPLKVDMEKGSVY